MNKGMIYLVLVSLMAMAIAACRGATPSPAMESKPTAQPTTQVTTAPQVITGMKVYDSNCSRCHGAALVDGSASKLSRPALAKYGTAQKLFDFIRQRMPKNNPGGLSAQEYYDVASYLLFQQGLLKPDQMLNADTAGSITLSE